MQAICPDGLHAVLRKGLRARLAAVLEALGRTDWNHAAQVSLVAGDLEVLLAHLEAHLGCEDLVLCEAALADEGVIRAVRADHAAQREACQVLAADIARLRLLPPIERDLPARRVQRRLAIFLAEYIEHMLCEEIELGALLRQTLSVAAWQAMELRSLACLPDTVCAQLQAWAMPVVTVQEWRALEAALETAPVRAPACTGTSPAGPETRTECRSLSYTPNCSW